VPLELGARQVLALEVGYHVVFVERPTFVAVVAVAHLAREPGYWRERVKDYPAL
jgi:hypothetical protein